MAVAESTHKVKDHFENRDPAVRATYDAVLTAAKKLGPVAEEAKKTSIHLVRSTAFAGVATRKSALLLTLKSAVDIESDRVVKHEKASANRWHLDIRLTKPGDVDRELAGWLRKAYDLAE
jgi:hypothetical protein